jgi:hypothetical protein
MVKRAHITCVSSVRVLYGLTCTHHAGRKEYPWFDVVKCDVAGYLPDCVSNSEDSVYLVQLVASEAQLLSHARHIGIV